MAKYKVGDRVKIRRDLESDTYYGNVIFVRGMIPFLGKEAVIKSVATDNSYLLDDSSWTWTNEMFEGLANIKVTKKRAKELAKKRNLIIKEIKSIKEYAKAFEDIEKEVNEWSEEMVTNYELNKGRKKQ